MADCRSCTSTGGSIRLGEPRHASRAAYNETVAVSVDIKSSALILPDAMSFDMVDMGTNGCIYHDAFSLPAGQTVSRSFNIRMPNRNLRIRISVTVLSMNIFPPGTLSWTCNDYKEITILLYDPSAKKFMCSEKKCIPNPEGSYLTKSECDNACGDGSSSMYIYIIAGVILLFMMMMSRR